MLLEVATALALVHQCAPQVSPATLLPILQVESGFDVLVIGVNGEPGRAMRPRSTGEAARLARDLIQQGRSVDLGLAQINSKNLRGLGLRIEDAFDPCANIAAAGRLLQENYRVASSATVDPQSALRIALSHYNTGDARRGFSNGYVRKVEEAARRLAVTRSQPSARPVQQDGPHRAPTTPAPVDGRLIFGASR